MAFTGRKSSASVTSEPVEELEQKGLSATAVATDPVVVSAELVRAAELVEGRLNGVVLMAQMPRTEAEVSGGARVGTARYVAGPAAHQYRH
jgi:hypothetical protein